MYHQDAAHQYTATAVETGSPARLVAMLYQGALRFIGEAEAAMAVRDNPRKADRINRAMRIVQELSNALDASVAPELVERLTQLYEYVEHELLQASTYNDPSHLDHARRVLDRLVGAWEQLADTGAGQASTHADPTERIDVPATPSLSISA